MDKLVNSIKAFPEMLQARPIVVNPDLVVLGGNMRLKACRIAGFKEVPVFVASWADALNKRFMIVDNTQYGAWDMDELGNNWNPTELLEWGLTIPWDDPTEDEPQTAKQCKHCDKMIP